MNENPTPSLERLLSHRRWVQGVARRLLRDEQAAEDLAQEAWVRAMRSPPDPERDPKPWLRRVLKNLASNTRRGRGRREKHEGAWRTSRETRSPEALVAEAEQHKRLVTLLLDLEEPFKTALVLRFYEGLGPKEIAERLGVPVGTVHSRIARAVERLKTRLDEEEDGNRRAWIAGLLPLAGLDRIAPAAAATTATSSLAGILIMTLSKPKFAFLTVLLLGCLVGGGIWLASDSHGDDPTAGSDADLLASEPAPTLEGRGAELTAEADGDPLPSGSSMRAPAADPTPVVRGIVRDAAGSPVSGAEVFALPMGSPGIDEEDFDKPRHARTRTAKDGTFEARVGQPDAIRLLAFAKGHTGASVVLDAATPGERVAITLGEPWHLRVRVADADGSWPPECELTVLDRAIDVLDRAVDPRRQALNIDLTAPASGNVREVALERAGSTWVIVYAPRGMAAVPSMVELTQPTEAVSIRIVRSARLTVRLLDASTGEPIPADAPVSGWMGNRESGNAPWSFGSRGATHTQGTNIAPDTYALEFNVTGYELWKGQVAFQAEGETRSLDIRLEPQRATVARGRLLLDVAAGAKSPKALLAFARLGDAFADVLGRYEMFARLTEGDRNAWNKTWGTRGGWGDLHLTPREDGSLELKQALYGVDNNEMPAGTYDIYVAERGTGRAAFASGIRVYGDQDNRYTVQLEPGTMFAVNDVLPGDEVFTRLEVRTAKTGSLPLLALRTDGSQTFNTPTSLEFLLRVPRKPLRLGPYPAGAIVVRSIDAKNQTKSVTVRGAGTVQR